MRWVGGYDLAFNYLFDDEGKIVCDLPFDPLSNPKHYEDSLKNDWGIAFSHSLEENIVGQLKAGFRISDLYEDTSGEGFYMITMSRLLWRSKVSRSKNTKNIDSSTFGTYLK